jgi:light-regulated signal transduction histidine kinase (bacteriophytochrome)
MTEHPRTIAIIDDCPEDRQTYRRYLEQDDRHTYQILEAEDGASGLILCEQAQPDLILLDYQLPDLNGLAFLDALSSQNYQIPVVMISEYGDESTSVSVEAMQRGVQDYLIKSEITPPSLGRVVRHAIERMRLFNDLQRAQTELRHQQQRSQLFADLTLKLRQSLQSGEILQTAVTEVQQLLNVDRVVIFRLEANGLGRVVQEAVVPGVPVTLGEDIYDPCFVDYLTQYRQGRVRAIADVEAGSLDPCHVDFLHQFAVRANLVVPILMRDSLWGLLIAHQCSGPRQWTDPETEFLQQLADQIGIALSQAEQLEQAIRQREELARSNTELERFAYVASHDLQEPLRMVTSYLQLIEQLYADKLDDEAREFIQFAVDGAARMRVLIQDLLAYSRVNTRGQSFERIQLSRLLERAIANLQLSIDESGATLDLEPLPEISGDSTQMTQLFQNLISNAIKFRQPTQPLQIQIGAARQAEDWLFWVTDNGIGIESQYTERIFLIFQRLHHRADYPGTGIGLAVCKKIVERHGGRLWVESQPGQGSKFHFTIPDRLSD